MNINILCRSFINQEAWKIDSSDIHRHAKFNDNLIGIVLGLSADIKRKNLTECLTIEKNSEQWHRNIHLKKKKKKKKTLVDSA